MLISVSLSFLLSLAPTALAGRLEAKAIHRTVDGEGTGRYIVRLKPGTSVDSLVSAVSVNETKVKEKWNGILVDGFAYDGEDDLEALINDDNVESIEEENIYRVNAPLESAAVIEQIDAPWGLQRMQASSRISGRDSELNFNYLYDNSLSPVDIYILDTGIKVDHEDFDGRARWGFVASSGTGWGQEDVHGHGTHCGAIAGGKQFGVAKHANLIAVKVLSDIGAGSTASVVSGLEYVGQQAALTGRPSIASLSLGGRASNLMDEGVRNLMAKGVHVVVAAGNANVDAGNDSPARVREAITVGAMNIRDSKWSSSNWGEVVDIFAPGENIISAFPTSKTASYSTSGTSQAAPHVAGLIAYYLSTGDAGLTPAQMKAKVISNAQVSVLSGIPDGTVNIMAHMDFQS